MPETLKGAVIGCGYFGRIQLQAWRRMPEVEIVAACDLDIERARGAAPHAYSSAEELLAAERLDFVDIATRPESHLALVLLAADRRVHAICQKPMARAWEEALSMVEAAEAAGIRLLIHENWRWQPWYRESKRLIDAGAIGQPFGYMFRTRQRDGLGPAPYPKQPYFAGMPRLLIYETLVHHIDTARFLFGDIARVKAVARRYNPAIAGEDQAVLATAHENGALGVIDGHRFLDLQPDGPAMGEAVFEGEQGTIHVLSTGDILCNGQIAWTNSVHEGYRGDSVRATQQHLIACLRSGLPSESDARDYLTGTFRVVEEAYRSLAEGGSG